jgi:NitT/TauT family transport system permease protein
MVRRAVTAFFFILLLAGWEFAVRQGWISSIIIPKPSDVARYFLDLKRDNDGAVITPRVWEGSLTDGTLLDAIWVTMRRLLSGYLIGLAIGIPAGIFCGRFEIVRGTIGQISLSLQTLPSVCWVPLSLIWFGQNENAILFIVVMGTVWSIIVATQDGVRGIPPLYLRAASTMGSRGFHLWTRVVLPASFPAIVGGMKQGWAFAWRSLMAGEIYVTILTGFGLGSLLHYGRELHRMDQVVGVMVIIMAVGLLADRILFSPIEGALRRRWGLER